MAHVPDAGHTPLIRLCEAHNDIDVCVDASADGTTRALTKRNLKVHATGTVQRNSTEVTEAAAFPHILGLSTQGFMDAMSGTHREKRTWRYERAGRDLVHFRMTRAL